MAEMRFDNARDPEQLRRMRAVAETGECYFCTGYTKNELASPIYVGLNWFVKRNDFPYPGSKHHYLIVIKDHITKITDLKTDEWLELQEIIKWLENQLSITGASYFIRSGDMAFTGATLDHLHCHLIVGEEKPAEATPENWLQVTLGYKK